MTSSPVVYPDYYSTPYDQTADYGPATCPKDEEEIIVIPEKFRHVFYGYDDEHVFVGMANPNEDPDEEDLLTFDCGATTTVTESLYNMTDVVPKVVTIQLAMDGMTMKSSHIGIKTYYVYDRTGSIRPVKTKALYVRELKQDLLGGKALTNTNHRIVLDSDDEIAGVYPKAMTVQLILQTVSHLLVNTRKAYFTVTSGSLKFLNRNTQSCLDMNYGTEG